MKVLSVMLASMFISTMAYGVKGLPLLGESPQTVELSGSSGGLADSREAWSSESLTGRLHLLIYVDPDVSELNDHFTDRLKAEAFPRDQFASVVVVNMAATWKPNMIIRRILAARQREFPDTTYVMDQDKSLVQEWALEDDDYNVLLFDDEGRVIFRRHGKLSQEEVDEFVKLVQSKLSDSAA